MVESLNTKVDLTVEAIAYLGFPKYGKIMIGDTALEFFNDRNVNDNMQFPWPSIQRAEAYVSKSGHLDKTFYLILNNNQKIRFSSADTGKILKLLRNQLGNDRVTRIHTFINTLTGSLLRRKNK